MIYASSADARNNEKISGVVVDDRRKFKRRNLLYHLEVFDAETGEPVGRMVDITPEGLMLISHRPVEVNTELHLALEMPSEILGNKRVAFTAQTRWCRHDINPDLFDTGLQFTEIGNTDIETIIGLIVDYSFPD
jgi:hypothetical protein